MSTLNELWHKSDLTLFLSFSHTKVEECVRTLLGRVRYLPEINSTDSIKSAMAERQAVNSIIQGTASDIMKYAMILIEKKINLVWKTITLLDVQGRPIDKPVLLMQIHDELIYEVPKVSIAKHSALTVYSLGVKNDANEFAAKHFANDAHNEVPLSSVIHEIIRFVMEKEVENNLKLSVPLIVNIHHGNDMGQLK